MVSDSGSAVVVTDHEGKDRFSYTGRSSRSRLKPRGICTDPLSNILVCDNVYKSVHVIDKDGQFLSSLHFTTKKNGTYILLVITFILSNSGSDQKIARLVF